MLTHWHSCYKPVNVSVIMFFFNLITQSFSVVCNHYSYFSNILNHLLPVPFLWVKYKHHSIMRYFKNITYNLWINFLIVILLPHPPQVTTTSHLLLCSLLHWMSCFPTMLSLLLCAFIEIITEKREKEVRTNKNTPTHSLGYCLSNEVKRLQLSEQEWVS